MIHPSDVPEHWARSGSIDFGPDNPTAYLVWTVDEDENLVVVDEYDSPGLALGARASDPRTAGVLGNAGLPNCYADPSMWSEYGSTTKRGRPASLATELSDHGVTALIRANNGRAAGYLRLRELLHPEAGAEIEAYDGRSGV